MKINLKNTNLMDYITNAEEVQSVVNNCNFNLIDKGFNNQSKQYDYILTINKKSFKYFEGSGLEPLKATNKEEKILSCLWCLLNDYTYKDYNILDFKNCLGYEDEEQAMKILKQIKRNSARLATIFNNKDMETLSKNINL